MKAISYQASGGESQQRTYESGEKVTIEMHRGGSFAVLWSSKTPLQSLVELVQPLLATSDREARLSKVENRVLTLPPASAVYAIEADPEGFNAALLHLGDEHISWEALNPEIPKLGEVGFATNNPASELLRRLLHETAMPQILEDADGIFGSVEHLTAQAS